MKAIGRLASITACALVVCFSGCTSSNVPNQTNDQKNNDNHLLDDVSSPVDLAEVKRNLTLDQLAIGEPVANRIGMVLVPIPPGEFMMSWAIEGQPKVNLKNAFFISATEVTQSQWKSVMGTSPWRRKSAVDSGDHFPVTDVTWEEAMEFCRKLSALETAEYRLPTEAEWEYACRAGTTTAFSFGDDQAVLDSYGWFRGNARSEVANAIWTRRVSRKKPNAWGLYDMHGNVEEMCLDVWSNELPSGNLSNPTGPENGSDRVCRGGSIRSDPENCRSAYREPFIPDLKADDRGFRVVREINSP